MGLKQRFENKSSLLEALLTQRVVLGDRDLAEELAAEGMLEEFVAGQNAICQGGSERDVYFILAGFGEAIGSAVVHFDRSVISVGRAIFFTIRRVSLPRSDPQQLESGRRILGYGK
jgi:hypothetical protein